ncbi:MAG: FAD:protein FMN transferase [Spirochaetes bacterium]|jgi:thiamine biosynthesis lipoprotein|nr:FAD:protein FMN transferase [Spirochaetota bacterium]
MKKFLPGYIGLTRFHPLLLILLSLALLTKWDCPGKGPGINDTVHVINGFVQATTFNIKFYLPENSALTDEKLEIEVRNRLNSIDLALSVYNNGSDISRFNRFRGAGWCAVSSETASVVLEAQRISDLSGGAFDITIAPLVEIWGFGVSPSGAVPPERYIKKAKNITGYNNLEVRFTPPAFLKKIPGLSINLSAIAQGYTVDSLAIILDKAGITSYMAEIGGEIKAKGRKPDGSPWRIGIAAPVKGRREIQLALELINTAVSTSGDYENYFEKNGKRYTHTINPKTGYPITHNLASVTVLHDSCMRADALATAINVLGPDEGYSLALKENLAVFMIIHNGEKFKEKMTPQFEKISTFRR